MSILIKLHELQSNLQSNISKIEKEFEKPSDRDEMHIFRQIEPQNNIRIRIQLIRTYCNKYCKEHSPYCVHSYGLEIIEHIHQENKNAIFSEVKFLCRDHWFEEKNKYTSDKQNWEHERK